ncbi:hypothetical protein pmac_cds_785 [Pandoravirus macleodensis]|uniref:Ankyrin repeat domain containing protein n=1 Tax=Pandoravirus macleodensis TaxID=2107707 RepID=A0A2U7UG45_9VIRU|nr:hypothetical protein pmac_cds_785 [Pandoravirus macleodensis]AVK77473.1 hypothetical protein pmac_cds_785 [Pandoravirus macleodensis]
MEVCDSDSAHRGPTLADMPPEVLSSILAWLPASAVGACLVASRLFGVLSCSAAARYTAECIAQSAAGLCPCSRLCASDTAAAAQAYAGVPAAAQNNLPVRIVGHARDCLPNALSAAAAAGRLNVVCALYRHAILLWYGDPKAACCIDPVGPDPARTLIDIVRSSMRDNIHCRLKSCVTCTAFLAWLFRCDQPIDRFVSAFPIALAAGHTTTAIWIGAVSSPYRLVQAPAAALAIIGDGSRAGARPTESTDRPKANTVALVDGADERDLASADEKTQASDCPAEDSIDDIVLACLWRACPTEARFVRNAAAAGDLRALQRVARVRRHAAAAFGESHASAFPAGLDAAICAATEWRTPKTTLAWLWKAFDLASDRAMCRIVAKVAPACGLLDLGIEALCAFRRHTAALICESLVETSHRIVHGRALAGYEDPDGFAGAANADLFDFLDNVDDEPATAKLPCAIVAQTVRSGCPEAIDVALSRWRQCNMCAALGGFACLYFWWSHIDKCERATLDAGLIHVVEAHPHVFPTYDALGAVMRSPRANNSLIERVASRSWTVPPHDAALWIKQAASNGCAAPILFLLQEQRTTIDNHDTIDTGPALIAAANAGHLDIAALLMPQPTRKPLHKSDLDVISAIEGAVRACSRSALAWVIQHVNQRLYVNLWAAAAVNGDVDLVTDMVRETQSSATPLKRPRSFVPFVSMAVAHGHVECASVLMDLDRVCRHHVDHDVDANAGNHPRDAAPDGEDLDRSRRAKRQRTRSRTTKATVERPTPTLAPSYVVDALGRGHTHAIDWAASGPFRIPWRQVSISSALDRIGDPTRLATVLAWLLQSRAAQESPCVVADLHAWAECVLASRDPVRIGSVIKHCPWRDWGISVASVARAMCHCPVAMWRTVDARRPGILDDPCFVDAVVASGRVDLAAWMVDERRPSDKTLFGFDHVVAADKAANVAMASWLAMRLVH